MGLFNAEPDVGQDHPSVIAVIGDAVYLREIEIRKLIDTYVPPESREWNCRTLYADECRAEDVREALQTFSMMGGIQIILVKRFDSAPQTFHKVVDQYVHDPQQSKLLLLEAGKIDQRKKWFQTVKKHGKVIECKKIYENKLPQWIASYLHPHGYTIEADAVHILIQIVGLELQDIVNELDKLMLYIGDRTEIRKADVEDLCAAGREYSVFDLLNAAGNRQTESAIRIGHELLEQGERPTTMLIRLAQHFYRLYETGILLKKGVPHKDIGRKLGLRPYFLQDYIQQAEQFLPEDYPPIFALFLETDISLKTGFKNTKLLFDRFLLQLCGST